LSVNDDDFTALWEKDIYSRGRYLLHGDDVLQLVTELEDASALHMTSGHPSYGDVSAKASLSNAGDSVAQMLDCFQDD